MSPYKGTALITGGGGSIARAIAMRLDKLGYRLLLTDINPARARETAAKLSRPAEIIACDQTNARDLDNLLRRVREEYPDLDVLVNNAGYIRPGDFLDLGVEEIERHMAVNLTSPVHLIRGIAPLMTKRNQGAIVICRKRKSSKRSSFGQKSTLKMID